MHWRLGSYFVAAALVLLAPGSALASASLVPYTLEDATGDVTRDGSAYSGPWADATDIVDARMEEGGDLAFTLTLGDLSGLPGPSADCEFHAQYAMSFQTQDGHAGYSMRATYRACPQSVVVGPWSFQLHDRQADEWGPVAGEAVGSSLHWRVSPGSLDLDDGDRIFEWDVQAWLSFDDGTQSNDHAKGHGWYVMGMGPAQEEPAAPAAAADGGSFGFPDDKGDVAVQGEPYTGPGADTTDVLWVGMAESGSDLVFTLHLENLSGLHSEAAEAGFHAQYAVSFQIDEDHAGYSTRATFGGEEYTSEPDGAWRFMIHDKQTDDWPDADGRIDGSSIVWLIPRSDFSTAAGDTLTMWQVQTWNSYDERDQYGDWAFTDASYALGSAKERAGDPESTDGNGTDDGEDPLEIPGPPAVFVVGGVLAALLVARRRRSFLGR